MKMVHRKTKIIVFERPLDPQPPYHSRPYWCYTNTLQFYKDGKKVWEQEIPEADLIPQKHPLREFDVYRIHKIGQCSVVRQKRWGWILRVRVDHEQAEKIWNKVFEEKETAP